MMKTKEVAVMGNNSRTRIADKPYRERATAAPQEQSRTGEATLPRARCELINRPAEQLEAEVIDLSGRLSVGTYELLVLVGELDNRGTWANHGALSCAAWLADTCEIETSTARTQVRVARAMRTYVSLDHALRDGDVSYAKARVLVAYLTEDNIAELLKIAGHTSAGRLGAAVAAWSQRNDDADTIRHRQHEARSMSWRTEPDGMVVITARLPPQTAGGLCAAIDTLIARNHAPAGASLAQQRADTLTQIVTGQNWTRSATRNSANWTGTTGSPGSATSGPADTTGTTDPTGSATSTATDATDLPAGRVVVTAEVVIHVNSDGNALEDGTPLSDHAVATLLPEAFVSLLLHDAERQPIDASPRRRFPTRRQRRVIDQIDHECRQDGCHATDFLQHDHIQPYAQGGPTQLDNLQRLCGPHNRARS